LNDRDPAPPGIGTLSRALLVSGGVLLLLFGLSGFVLPFWIILRLADLPPGDWHWSFLGSAVATLPFGALPAWLGYVLLRKAKSKAAPEPAAARVQASVASAEMPAAASIAETPPPPGPRRRAGLVYTGIGLVVLSLPICLIVALKFVSEAKGQSAMDNFGAAFVLAVLMLPLVLGAFLVHWGEPGIGRRFLADLRGGASGLFSPSGLLRLTSTAPGHGAVTAAVSLPLMFVFRPAAWLVALVALCVFAVVDPALNALRPSWWVGAVLSIGTWLILLSGLVGLADNLNRLRESTMVYLLPFMIYPAALLVSGLVRLVRWKSALVPNPGGGVPEADTSRRTES
jgi:hypothetical protein